MNERQQDPGESRAWEYLKPIEGDAIFVIRIEPERHRIGFSLRQVGAEEELDQIETGEVETEGDKTGTQSGAVEDEPAESEGQGFEVGPIGEAKAKALEETRPTYRLQGETLPPEEADKISLASHLDQIAIELSKLSNQMAEMQEQLSSILHRRHMTPPTGEVDKPREITFREFLGAIWW